MKPFILMLLVFIFPIVLATGAAATEEKVGILAALPQELAAIREGNTFRKSVVGDAEFHVGQFEGKQVAVTLSGGGKVNAAVAAQRLISNFNVTALVFVGVGGAINPEFEIGDVVVATETFQHDYGFMGDKFVPHLPGTMPELGWGTGKEYRGYRLAQSWPTVDSFPKGLLESALETFRAAESELTPIQLEGVAYQPKIRKGIMATGDQFVARNDKKIELRNLGADVVEMEGAAIAQVATKNGVPFLLFRSLSDKAGNEAKIDFGKFVSAVSHNHSILLKKLLRSSAFGSHLSAAAKVGSRSKLSE